MVFDGVKFNDEWVLSKTESEFIEHEKHTLPEEKLREVYALIQLINGNSQEPIQQVKTRGRKPNSSR